MGKIISGRLANTVFTVLISGVLAIQVAAADAQDDSGWEFKATGYLWVSTLEAELPTGEDIEIDFDTIVDNLDIALMGGLTAHNGKWGLYTDLVYMDLEDDENNQVSIPVGPLDISRDVDVDVELKSWIVNLAGAYTLINDESHQLDVLVGVRYLWLDMSVSLQDDGPIVGGKEFLSADDQVFDAIVGVNGRYALNENWYIPYRFDIGAGESDLTWNALGGVGYRFGWGDVIAGYRYLHYDFGSDFELLADLDVHGPLIAAQWHF